MFFILSKILSVALSPIIWILIFLVAGIFSKNTIKKKHRIIFSLFLLFFFSNGFVLSIFQPLINTKPVKVSELQKNYDYGIVLGGFSVYDKEYKRIRFFESSDRLWQTLQLYKSKRITKILISGGSGKLINNSIKESNVIKQFLIGLGIKSQDIVVENKSKNTYENALYTSKIPQIKNSSCLLITSSLHMFRAKKCFEKADIKLDIFPTNYSSGENLLVSDYIIPSSKVLLKWNDLLHELTGIVIYKIAGKI